MRGILASNATTKAGDCCRWWRLGVLEGWTNGVQAMGMRRKGESPVTIFPVIQPEICPVVEMTATVRRRMNQLLSPPSEGWRSEMGLDSGHGDSWDG